MLQGLGLSLSWLWKSNNTSHHPQPSLKQKRKSRNVKNATAVEDVQDGYFPGLVNISGTYCFMNSTVQALSSLSYFQPQIEAIHAKAEALDVPTPVIDALRDLFHRLNTPHSSYTTIRPVDLISVLSSQPDGRSNSLFNSREHQDAQELFQLLSECVKTETASVEKERARDRGFGDLSQAADANKEIGKSVFDGLTANRRSCVVCGYTEAVMHFAFDNMQLAVPGMASSCHLEDCLEDYTRLEVLHDCICRRCSVNATHRRLLQEVDTLQTAIDSTDKPSASKKRRLKEVKKMEARVKAALEEGRIEDDIKDVRMEKVFGVSTKQAMIARPPPILALHINRSLHFSHFASKNNIRVLFPEVLDLTSFTTSGSLSMVPTSSLSSPSTHAPRSSTPTPSSYPPAQSRTIYRLAGIVCHFGAHSFGHYICYRRKPRYGAHKWKPPRLIFDPERQKERERSSKKNDSDASAGGKESEGGDADVSSSNSDSELGGGEFFFLKNGGKPKGSRSKSKKRKSSKINGPAVISDAASEALIDYVWEDDDPSVGPGTGKGWLRISDDSVGECGIENVLQEGSGVFMLYYERATISSSPEAPSVPAPTTTTVASASNSTRALYGIGTSTPLSSEETLKPEMMVNGIPNGSAGSLLSLVSTTSDRNARLGSSPPSHARIVQSVAAGRGRSMSATPDGSPRSSVSSSSRLSPGSSYTSYSRPIAIPQVNGISTHDEGEPIPQSMSSSAPSLLSSKMTKSEPSSSLTRNRQPHNHTPVEE